MFLILVTKYIKDLDTFLAKVDTFLVDFVFICYYDAMPDNKTTYHRASLNKAEINYVRMLGKIRNRSDANMLREIVQEHKQFVERIRNADRNVVNK